MKKLLFIDNDDKLNEDQMDYVVDFLGSIGYSKQEIESMDYVLGFWGLSRDEQFEKIVKSDAHIVTWSVYTLQPGICDSKSQFFKMMVDIARYEISGRTYVDCTGLLKRAIWSVMSNREKGLFEMALGINNNTIITKHPDTGEPCRLTIDINSYNEYIKIESISKPLTS